MSQHQSFVVRSPNRRNPRLTKASSSFHPMFEPLEDRTAPALDFWQAPAAVSADWSVAADWSLQAPPGPNDIGVFDAVSSVTPCKVSSSTSCSGVIFSANLPANSPDYLLTVSSVLQLQTLTVKARTAGGGNEIWINSGAEIDIYSNLDFSGGNIAGSLNSALAVLAPSPGPATAHVAGAMSSAADPPTLSAPLILGYPNNDGGQPGGGLTNGTVTLDFNGVAGQPLNVGPNAVIEVNAGATFTFDDQPLPGMQTAFAINNTVMGGNQTIYVNDGGVMSSDGQVARTVAMGVSVEGFSRVGIGGRFNVTGGRIFGVTGQNISGRGLSDAGTVRVTGALAVDYGATINGGALIVIGSVTLGTNAASAASTVDGGGLIDIATGALTSHGGLTINNGNLDVSGSPANNPATITVDAGNAFTFLQGNIQLTLGMSFGVLDVNGTFTASGGTITDRFNSAANFGRIRVNGDVNLSSSCLFSVTDVGLPTGSYEWPAFTWTRVRNGAMTISWTFSDVSATYIWDDTNKQLVFMETIP